MEIWLVAIAHNEERDIERSLEASLGVVKALKERGARTEVLLVDDCSSDGTVDKARKFPVRIIRMMRNSGPAAACYVGTKEVRSGASYIIYFGADMELDVQGILRGLETMERDVGIGALSGIHRNHYADGRIETTDLKDGKGEKLTMVETFAGCGIFRYSALIEAGSFNPYIRIGEEGEVCMRIAEKGYRIAFIHEVLADHLDCASQTTHEVLAKKFKRIYQNNLLVSAAKGHPPILKSRLAKYPWAVATMAEIVLLVALAIFFMWERPVHYFLMASMVLGIRLVATIAAVQPARVGLRRFVGAHVKAFPATFALLVGLARQLPSSDLFKVEIERVQ